VASLDAREGLPGIVQGRGASVSRPGTASLRAGAARLGHPKMPNATKLNNALWRWFGSGPRNPPVIIRLHGSAKVHRLGTIAGQRSREILRVL
jgi:hypothetical protein